ncbi:hypothetical protein ASPTUDRAFT_38176, partial [Aspergillus tubingensis CBS 134.48]
MPHDRCHDGTTANTASQLQTKFLPNEVAQDRLFFTALLASNQCSIHNQNSNFGALTT